MDYITYKKQLKRFRLSSTTLSKVIDFHKDTPSSLWKKRDKVPTTISIILELLEKLPEDERVLYIHNKLKEAENRV